GAGEPTLLEHMHVRAGRPLPSARVEVSRELDAVVTTAMSIEPESRYPSAQAFLEALRAATAGGPTLDRGVAPRSCRAIGLWVEPRALADAFAGGDESVLMDLDYIPALARTFLTSHGFSVALEIGSSILCVRVLPDDPAAERQARLGAIAEARALVQKLSQRGGASARVHVNVCLHAADATLRG